MDPNVALEECREFVAMVLYEEIKLAEAEVARFAGAVEALDEWLVKGGFLPRAWKNEKRE